MGKEQKTEHIKEQSPTHWRDKFPLHYVGPKRQNKRAMQVFMEPQVREDIKALARIEEMGAQEFVERLITKEVNDNQARVREGRKLLQESDKKFYRGGMKILQEENDRLKKALEAATNPRRHR